MNKTELIAAVAQSASLSKTDAERALTALTSTIEGALANGDSVAITGFGTFAVGERAERTGRNPKTGEAITIAAAKTPKFKAGKGLKDAVNG